MTLAIIMPVLNEGAALAQRLRRLQTLRAQGVQLRVVDGGSTDTSWALASALADRVVLAPRGRAAQMNAGASGCQTDVLLFLHADTQLPADAGRLIEHALQQGQDWGRFDVRIDGTQPVLRLVERLMNLRSRLTGICTGDQALFVRRSVFESLGGFADLPLMEDIDLSARLRQLGAPACLRQTVTTSGRRWEKHGVWRTILLMWRLRAAYFFGADPSALALLYGYTPEPTLSRAALAVLAKAPLPGLAKTRLIPALGAVGAARAQRLFTRRTLHMARQAALGPLTLWCAPDQTQRFFRALQRTARVACKAQPEGDLGARMQHACEHHFARHPDLPLLLLGTDCAVLAPAHLRQAAIALLSHEVVVIPAEDGGYVLIGMRRLLPQVFANITWSTPLVMAQTRERLLRSNLSWYEMDTLWDVDEPADWQRLRQLEGNHED